MSLWVPSPEERLMVDHFAQQYVEKEAAGGSGRRGDIGPARLNNAKIGKFAELAWVEITGGQADFSLWSKGADASAPDITDDPANRIKPDWRHTNLHVKTCQLKFFGGTLESWTASRWDRIVTDPTDIDLLLLGYTEPTTGDTIRLGWLYATEVKDLWRPCYARALAHKQAIYFKDIHHLIRPI